MKKKLLILLPILLVLLSLLFIYMTADNGDDTSDIKKITESYLEKCTYNMYMYTDNDLKSSTILELPDNTVKTIAGEIEKRDLKNHI